jgi:hypothetical protein
MENAADHRFSDGALMKIVDQAGIYMCACPAQLAVQLLELRKLCRYQLGCMKESPELEASHRCIAAAAQRAQALLEDALDEVLRLEGWDKDTLTMPEDLRARRDSQL